MFSQRLLPSVIVVFGVRGLEFIDILYSKVLSELLAEQDRLVPLKMCFAKAKKKPLLYTKTKCCIDFESNAVQYLFPKGCYSRILPLNTTGDQRNV